jgi:hypothetical protein
VENSTLSAGLLAAEGEGCSCRCSRRGGRASLLCEVEIGCCRSHDCYLVVCVCVRMARMLGGRGVKASMPAVDISNKEKEDEED